MKRFKLTTFAAIVIMLTSVYQLYSQIPAFPGAEGFGSNTIGGRGGQVIEVTSLSASGPGSFREAVMTPGPRIVVFRVSGTIDMGSSITISEPYLTIAGQTAPGDGICLKGKELIVGTHDVIIRGLRIRLGDQSGNKDGMRLTGSKGSINNVIIDHCSISWAVDENLSVITLSSDITFSWNIISEALYASENSFGFLIGNDGPNRISIHHNLFAHNRSRNAKYGRGGTGEFINNVVYNYGSYGTGLSPGTRVNIVGNTYIAGPNTLSGPQGSSPAIDIQLRAPNGESGDDPLIYVFDNIGPGRENGNGDEWAVVDGDQIFQSNQPVISGSGITTLAASVVKDFVLQYAGTISPKRDAVDTRVVEDVINGTGGIITSQNDVGGWPELNSTTPPADSDHDGMPDTWETARGLNPNDPADRNGLNSDGYTNVEVYINSLLPDMEAITSVEETTSSLPREFQLKQNYPNPFNPSTQISYSLNQREHVRLNIFNGVGQLINTLVNGMQEAGEYDLPWNATDFSGNKVASGIYYYQLATPNSSQFKKMLFLK